MGWQTTIQVELEVTMKAEELALAKVIGNTIAKRRKAAGLTQEQVAERLSIGNEAVSRIERGTVIPTVVRLIELAEIFDCPVADLLIASSTRADDQSSLIAAQIGKLSNRDRVLVLELVEKLSDHLAG